MCVGLLRTRSKDRKHFFLKKKNGRGVNSIQKERRRQSEPRFRLLFLFKIWYPSDGLNIISGSSIELPFVKGNTLNIKLRLQHLLNSSSLTKVFVDAI